MVQSKVKGKKVCEQTFLQIQKKKLAAPLAILFAFAALTYPMALIHCTNGERGRYLERQATPFTDHNARDKARVGERINEVTDRIRGVGFTLAHY